MKQATVDKIINSGYECCMAITGGGMGAIDNLTRYGGASKFLVSAHVPYCKNSFNEFTGHNREKDFVSLEACKELTYSAHEECCRVGVARLITHEKSIGLGVTAKMTYDGEREGREHEAFIGVVINNDRNVFYKVEFKQDYFYHRAMQEECLCHIILSILARLGGSKVGWYSRPEYEDGFTITLVEGKGL